MKERNCEGTEQLRKNRRYNQTFGGKSKVQVVFFLTVL